MLEFGIKRFFDIVVSFLGFKEDTGSMIMPSLRLRMAAPGLKCVAMIANYTRLFNIN